MPSKNALVSAIITTCRREISVLRKAISSVISQTYSPIEIIVVNDNVQESFYYNDIILLMNEFEEKVTLINNFENKGACFSRNAGIASSRGEYIAFLDDDDEWLPNKIEEQMKLFDEKDVALVYCENYIFYQKTNKMVRCKRKNYKTKVSKRLLRENCIGSTSFPLIRKKNLLEVGCFDESMPSVQDLDLWIRLSKSGKCVLCQKPLAVFNVYSGERISNNPIKGIEGRIKLIEKNWDFYSCHRTHLAYRLITLAPFYAKNKNNKLAFLTFFKGCFFNPLDIFHNLKEFLHVIKYAFKRKR